MLCRAEAAHLGGAISTLSKEPPSRKAIKVTVRWIRKFYRQIRLYLKQLPTICYPRTLAILALGVAVGYSQVSDLVSIFNLKNHIAGNHDEDPGYIIGKYFALANFATVQPALATMAFNGQNMGGSSAFNSAIAPVKGDNTASQYVVKAGDTLSGIAAQYNLHSGSIALANNDLPDTETLQVGQVLTIPPQDASDDDLTKEFSERQKKIAVAAAKAQKLTKNVSLTQTKKSTNFLTPVSYSYISQYFSSGHPGVDMVTPVGTPIKAAQAGCIISIGGGWNGGYGNMIHLNHGGGVSTLYAHMSSFAKGMDNGSCVDAGQVIGYVGLTGRTTGAHLHYEYRVNGVPQNPL